MLTKKPTEDQITNAIEQAKTSLRLTTDAFNDTELRPLVLAAIEDMAESLDAEVSLDRPEDMQTLLLYVIAFFGQGNDNAYKLYQKRLNARGLKRTYHEDV